MNPELDGEVVADFKVIFPSDVDPQPVGDPGRSLFAEVQSLKQQVADLCNAIRALVSLQKEANQKVDGMIETFQAGR